MATVVVTIAALIVLFGAAAGNDPLVTIKQGRLEGITETSTEGNDFSSFLGIPYAKPPLEKLRFEEPVPAEGWSDIRNAKNYPAYCLQHTEIDCRTDEVPDAKGSEDCLYLNVHTPKVDKSRKKAVMVYIHGGNNMRGAALDYRPYVLLNEDIVLVVIQYRLGIFGFLTTEDTIMSGNYGYKDMILALKWVQENVEEFGGDPSRVTIFGHGSGGAACQLLTLLPSAKGLMHRAILQSAVYTVSKISTRAGSHLEKAHEAGDAVGCPFNMEPQQYKDCMQKVDALDLFQTYEDIMEDHDEEHVKAMPFIDGVFLPEEPFYLLKTGTVLPVDILIGRTRDEHGLVVLNIVSVSSHHDAWMTRYRTIIKKLIQSLSDEHIDLIAHRYFAGKSVIERNQWPSLIKFFDETFVEPYIYVTSHFMSKPPLSTTYLYEFSHRGQFSSGDVFPEIEGTRDWVVSGDDLFYLFYDGPIYHRQMIDANDLKMRKTMTSLWTNFARTGYPTPDDSLGFTWDPITGQDYRFLNITLSPRMQDKDTEALRFYSLMPLPWTTLMKSTTEGNNRFRQLKRKIDEL